MERRDWTGRLSARGLAGAAWLVLIFAVIAVLSAPAVAQSTTKSRSVARPSTVNVPTRVIRPRRPTLNPNISRVRPNRTWPTLRPGTKRPGAGKGPRGQPGKSPGQTGPSRNPPAQTGPTRRPSPGFRNPFPRNPPGRTVRRPRPRGPGVRRPRPRRPVVRRPVRRPRVVRRKPFRRANQSPVNRRPLFGPARTVAGPLNLPLFEDSQVVVVLGRNATAATVQAIAADYGLSVLGDDNLGQIGARIVTFAIPPGAPVQGFASQIAGDPRVAFSQANFIYGTAAAGLPQYAIAKLDVAAAHQIARGRGVAVAVIDSGIDMSHPVLQGAIAGQFDATNRSDKTPAPHGTAVAGIIAAQRNLSGVAPGARILAIRAFTRPRPGSVATSNSRTVVRAIDWAMQQGAKVINMSFAGPRDGLIEAAINLAASRGIVVVAAAGNNGAKAPPAYPAAYDTVIAVTATDADDKLFSFANQGDYVAVAAPGVDIVTAAPGQKYVFQSGTSMAAAHVSGIIALMRELAPELTLKDVMAQFASKARDLGVAGRDTAFGHGLIGAADAVQGTGLQAARTGGQ